MSVLKRVGRQATFYAIAEALSSLTGFISFPILTRIFTQAQYGVMGLVDSSIKFVSTVSGMGLRPAVVRLWGEFKTGKRPGGTEVLSSSMLNASLAIGATFTGLLLLVLLVPPAILDARARNLIAMGSGLILFGNLTQMVQSILQSQERAALRSSIILVQRYLAMGLPLLFVAVFRWGLTGFFGGVLVAEGLIFTYCVRYARRSLHWSPRVMDLPIVREAMLYGLPLLGLNVSGFVTDWSDRFLLSYFRAESELGLYTAGYSMANYAVMFFVPALNSALIPVTMNVWSEEGPDSARDSLERFLRYYALVALPVVFGVSAVAPELIGLLASEKFAESATVIPWVLAAKVIQGAYYPFLAGLFLTKRTGWLAAFLGMAALINLGLNWLMIPDLGMMGAAITTLIAYGFYVFGGGLFSQRFLRLRFPVRSLLIYGAAAAIMFLVVRAIPTQSNHAFSLGLRIPAGALVYLAFVGSLDRDARGALRQVMAKIRRR